MSGSNPVLGEIANEAAIERSSFLVDAARQLDGFLKANAGRIAEVGGLVLIDDDPDYLSVAPDGSFRSRTRYQDEATGEWVSETDAAFADAAREAAGLPAEPTGTDELMEAAGIAPEERSDPYAGAADDWAGARAGAAPPPPGGEAPPRLYDLALSFQERSQDSESRLIERFEAAAADLAGQLGDLIIVDDDDERLTFRDNGHFH